MSMFTKRASVNGRLSYVDHALSNSLPANEINYTLLPVTHQSHGTITALGVNRNDIYVGTSTCTLMKYHVMLVENESLNDTSLGSVSNTSALRPQPLSYTSNAFTLIQVTQQLTVECKKYHLRHSGKGMSHIIGRDGSSTNANISISDISVCPALSLIFVLSDTGILCTYDLATLAYLSKIILPHGKETPIDRISWRIRYNEPADVVRLCVCSGKRLYVYEKSIVEIQQQSSLPSSPTNANAGTSYANNTAATNHPLASSSSTINPSSTDWTVTQELVLPESVQCVTWINDSHVLVGFRREYSVLHIDTGDVTDLCMIDSGEPILHRLPDSRVIMHTGNKAVVHSFVGSEAHVLVDAMLYPLAPRSIASTPLFAFVLDSTHVHIYIRPAEQKAWRVAQNIPVTNASLMWSDGGSLVLLAKGAQLYYFQPMRAIDKQKDAMMMWNVKSNYFLAPPTTQPVTQNTTPISTPSHAASANSSNTSPVAAAASAQSSSFASPSAPSAAETALREDALKQIKAYMTEILTPSSTGPSSSTKLTHPFGLMVRAFEAHVVKMIVQVMKEMEKEKEKEAAVTPRKAEIAALNTRSPVVNVVDSPPLTLPSSSSSLTPPPTRQSIIESIRDFQYMMSLAMQVAWSEICTVPRPPEPVVQTPSNRRGSKAAPDAASTSTAASSSPPSPPRQDFLSDCLQFFNESFFTLLSPRLFKMYYALTEKDDMLFSESCMKYESKLVTMEEFGSALIMKSPWMQEQQMKRQRMSNAHALTQNEAAALQRRTSVHSSQQNEDTIEISHSSSMNIPARVDSTPPMSVEKTNGIGNGNHHDLSETLFQQSTSLPQTPSFSSLQPNDSTSTTVTTTSRKNSLASMVNPLFPPISNLNNSQSPLLSSPNPLLEKAIERTGPISTPTASRAVSSPTSPVTNEPTNGKEGAWVPPSSSVDSSTSTTSNVSTASTAAPTHSALVLSTLLLDTFQPSISLLRMLPYPPSPSSKLRLLTRVHHQLLRDAQKFYDPTNVQLFMMSADELLPIMCFVLIHSKLTAPFAETEFMADFLQEEAMLGADGYIITTMQIALSQLTHRHGHVEHSTAMASLSASPLFASLTANAATLFPTSPLTNALTRQSSSRNYAHVYGFASSLTSPTSFTPSSVHRISQHFVPTPHSLTSNGESQFSFGPSGQCTTPRVPEESTSLASSPAAFNRIGMGIGGISGRFEIGIGAVSPKKSGIGSSLLAASLARTTSNGTPVASMVPSSLSSRLPPFESTPSSSPSITTSTPVSALASPIPLTTPMSTHTPDVGWNIERDEGSGKEVQTMELKPMGLASSTSATGEPAVIHSHAFTTSATASVASTSAALLSASPASSTAASTSNRLLSQHALLSTAQAMMTRVGSVNGHVSRTPVQLQASPLGSNSATNKSITPA